MRTQTSPINSGFTITTALVSIPPSLIFNLVAVIVPHGQHSASSSEPLATPSLCDPCFSCNTPAAEITPKRERLFLFRRGPGYGLLALTASNWSPKMPRFSIQRENVERDQHYCRPHGFNFVGSDFTRLPVYQGHRGRNPDGLSEKNESDLEASSLANPSPPRLFREGGTIAVFRLVPLKLLAFLEPRTICHNVFLRLATSYLPYSRNLNTISQAPKYWALVAFVKHIFCWPDTFFFTEVLPILEAVSSPISSDSP